MSYRDVNIGDFVVVLDLDHPKYSELRIFGRVESIHADGVSLAVDKRMGFGPVIKRDHSLIEPCALGDVSPFQLEGLGIPLSSAVRGSSVREL